MVCWLIILFITPNGVSDSERVQEQLKSNYPLKEEK